MASAESGPWPSISPERGLLRDSASASERRMQGNVGAFAISWSRLGRNSDLESHGLSQPVSRAPARSMTTPITARRDADHAQHVCPASPARCAIARLASAGKAANSSPSIANTRPIATRNPHIRANRHAPSARHVCRRVAGSGACRGAGCARSRGTVAALAASDRRSSGRTPNPASAPCACRCGRRPAS